LLSFVLLLLAQSNPITGGNFETYFQIDAPLLAEKFGSSVDGLGDINGDGVPDFIVGSKLEDNAMENAGAARVYSGADASVLFHIEGTASNQYLGARVASAGDLNKDHVPDFLISSPKADGPWQTDGGRVWAYSGDDGQILYEFAGSYPNERLGFAICGAGDANSDGYDDFAITSAPYSGLGGGAHGTVYLMSGADGSILHTILDPGPNNSQFGSTLAGIGDLNHDSIPDLLVGAPSYASVATDSVGAVFVYSGATGVRIMKIEGPHTNSKFGCSAANAGDINSDGIPDLVIGASDADLIPNSNSKEGMAFLYSGSDGSLILKIPGMDEHSGFGTQVCAAGDINLDGIPDIVVNAPDDDQSDSTISYFSGADGTYFHGVDALQASMAPVGDVNQDGHQDLVIGQPKSGNGVVIINGLNPYFYVGNNDISARHGGNLVMRLDFPDSLAGLNYKVLLSATGTGPIQSWVDIPLSPDVYFWGSVNGNYPGTFSYRLHGSLDAEGDALTTLAFGNGLPNSMVGSTFWIAAAVTNPGGNQAIYSSVARPILVNP